MTQPHSRKVQGIREIARRARDEPDNPEAQRYLAYLADLTSDRFDSEQKTQETKIRENRLRRMAARQGLALRKSPRRDPHALGYGTYMLTDINNDSAVAQGLPDGYGLNLDQIEQELTSK